jgi:hypothetical protein
MERLEKTDFATTIKTAKPLTVANQSEEGKSSENHLQRYLDGFQ